MAVGLLVVAGMERVIVEAWVVVVVVVVVVVGSVTGGRRGQAWCPSG